MGSPKKGFPSVFGLVPLSVGFIIPAARNPQSLRPECPLQPRRLPSHPRQLPPPPLREYTVNLFNVPMSAVRSSFVRRTALGVTIHPGTPPIEEIAQFLSFFSAESAFNLGFEHPVLQDLMVAGSTEIDDQARVAGSAEIAKFHIRQRHARAIVYRQRFFPAEPQHRPLGHYGGDRRLAGPAEKTCPSGSKVTTAKDVSDQKDGAD